MNPTIRPADLQRLDSAELRRLAALIAGILAHRDTQTALAYRRIADRLDHKPRVAA